MWFGGLTILLYIIYHIAHLTFGATVPGGYHATNVYQNVVNSFQVWWIVAVYLVAQVALACACTMALEFHADGRAFEFNHFRNKFTAGFATLTCWVRRSTARHHVWCRQVKDERWNCALTLPGPIETAGTTRFDMKVVNQPARESSTSSLLGPA